MGGAGKTFNLGGGEVEGVGARRVDGKKIKKKRRGRGGGGGRRGREGGGGGEKIGEGRMDEMK